MVNVENYTMTSKTARRLKQPSGSLFCRYKGSNYLPPFSRYTSSGESDRCWNLTVFEVNACKSVCCGTGDKIWTKICCIALNKFVPAMPERHNFVLPKRLIIVKSAAGCTILTGFGVFGQKSVFSIVQKFTPSCFEFTLFSRWRSALHA